MHFQSRSNRAVVTTHEHQDQEQQQHQDVHPLFSLLGKFIHADYFFMYRIENLIHVVFYRFLYVVRNIDRYLRTCFACTQRMHFCQK